MKLDDLDVAHDGEALLNELRYDDGSGDQAPKAVVVRMSDVKPERIDWLWTGRLARGKLHIIDGDPGLGKSTIGISWAATITTGGFWPDGEHAGTPAGVVILSAEDGLGDTIRPRLDAAGADTTRVVALTGVRRTDRDTGETYETPPTLADLTALEDAVRQVDAALVVIDPLMAYLGGDVNSYRDQDVRRALAPLAALAERLKVAVVIVRHLRKQKGSAVHSGGGSIGIIGAARVGFTVGPDPQDENRLVIACSKTNIGTRPPALAYRLMPDELHGCARVEWLGAVEVTADDLTAERDRGDRGAVDEAREWLVGYLADHGGEAARADIMKAGRAAGHSKDALDRAKVAEKIAHESRSQFPRSTVWILPDALQSSQAPTTEGRATTATTGVTSGNTPNAAQSSHSFNIATTATTGGSGECIEPGCDRPPRRACRTCWDHRDRELAR